MQLRALLAVAVTGVGVIAAPGVQAADTHPWHAWHSPVGGVFRSAAYEGGEWVYTNGVTQGLGPNTDRVHRDEYTAPIRPLSDDGYRLTTCDLFGTHRAWHNGDFVLPTDRSAYPDFTGELSELRLAIDGSDLFIRFLFPSFPAPDTQIATLTFAPGGSHLTPTAWPANAGLKSPWTVALTTWGTGATLTTEVGATSAGDKSIADVGGAVRTTDHAIEVRLPLSLLPHGRWLLTGGSGLTDPLDRSQYWTVPPGDATSATPGNEGLPVASTITALPPNVWSLLFADDYPWKFDEQNQADLLAGGEVTQARQVVDPRLLERRVTRAPAVRVGLQSRLFLSSLDQGDGISRSYVDFTDGSNSDGMAAPIPPNSSPAGEPGVGREFLYTGRTQYYGMFVPSSYPAAARKKFPLIVYLHGLNGLPCEPFNNVDGFAGQLEQHGYLLASPLGRGDYWYRGPGELDVLQVIRDVEKHYRVDPNRIYLMGHSMGGAGTYNVALRHPDLFAGVVPAEGVDSADLWSNARNLPWFHIGAAFDADPDATAGKAFYADLSAQGWNARLLEYHSKTHEYSTVYDTLPQIFDFFGTQRRDAHPAHVTFTVPSDADPKIGLADDSAYWVSGLQRAGSGPATIDAVTFGIAHRDIDAKGSKRIDEEQTDQGGLDGHDSTSVYLQTTPKYGALVPRSNRAKATLTGLSAATLDLALMRLTTSRVLRIECTTDTAATLTLLQRLGQSVAITVDGRHVATTADQALDIALAEGSHAIVIRPFTDRLA